MSEQYRLIFTLLRQIMDDARDNRSLVAAAAQFEREVIALGSNLPSLQATISKRAHCRNVR